jgi:hypothetical protein
MVPVLRQIRLPSQGPVDLLDTTHMSPAGSYVRSHNKHNQQCNVNASYHTVSLKIKERRLMLVIFIVLVLGADQRYWCAADLRPDNLLLSPLDWSRTLLQNLGVFARSLPCDTRNTTVEHRLRVAHEAMLAEALSSSEPNNSTDSTRMHHATSLSGSSTSRMKSVIPEPINKNYWIKSQTLDDEVFGLGLYKELSDQRMSDLKVGNRVQDAVGRAGSIQGKRGLVRS